MMSVRLFISQTGIVEFRPAADLVTFGLHGKALPFRNTTPEQSNAAAERIAVPALPGSDTLSRTRTVPPVNTSVIEWSGIGQMAVIPWELPVLEMSAKSSPDT